MDRKKLVTLLVVLFTVVLAGVAVFTAVQLYQNQQPVAPTAPTSIPRAQEASPSPGPSTTSCTDLTLTLGTPACGSDCNPSTPNSCPENQTCSTTTNKCVLTACLETGATCDVANCNLVTTTPTPTPTPTPAPASCNNACSGSQPCDSGLTCVSGSCRNPSCTNETDCTCAVAQTTPTPEPELPQAGTTTPTIIGGIIGILAIIGALALAL